MKLAAMSAGAHKREAKRLKALARAEAGWVESHYRKTLAPLARTEHIAHAYLLGREYEEIEDVAFTEPNWDAIEASVMSQSQADERHAKQLFGRWLFDATYHFYMRVPR